MSRGESAAVKRLIKSILGASTHYEVLGVEEDASAEDIGSEYRDLARTVHPDKGGDAAAFKKLANAKDVLLDQNSRMAYDLELREAREPAPAPKKPTKKPAAPKKEPKAKEPKQEGAEGEEARGRARGARVAAGGRVAAGAGAGSAGRRRRGRAPPEQAPPKRGRRGAGAGAKHACSCRHSGIATCRALKHDCACVATKNPAACLATKHDCACDALAGCFFAGPKSCRATKGHACVCAKAGPKACRADETWRESLEQAVANAGSRRTIAYY
ncbi:hypothetical protein JL721_980 [Aureococcus anophagefferens]|nr:hypothetical protein JL721_980 [Aureococcus anophagefferens]